jgi:hypothetical protein
MTIAGVFIALVAIKFIVILMVFLAEHGKKNQHKNTKHGPPFLLSYSSKSLYKDSNSSKGSIFVWIRIEF